MGGSPLEQKAPLSYLPKEQGHLGLSVLGSSGISGTGFLTAPSDSPLTLRGGDFSSQVLGWTAGLSLLDLLTLWGLTWTAESRWSYGYHRSLKLKLLEERTGVLARREKVTWEKQRWPHHLSDCTARSCLLSTLRAFCLVAT